MRISDKGSCHFTISQLEIEPRQRDIRANVSVEGNGFAGANDSVWFERTEIDRFVAKLRALDRSREGIATLETMSPGECVLTFRTVDKAGHILLDVQMARLVYTLGKAVYFRCRVGFEVDSSEFSRTIEELADELKS
jgi:hypothetical protein